MIDFHQMAAEQWCCPDRRWPPPTINAMFSDLQYLVLTIPALLFSLGTQWKVNSTFRRFANVGVQSGYNGAQAAQAVMQSAGVQRVRI
jgi:Zn-dependent membrane protease YugP